jgi:hypothetical protein
MKRPGFDAGSISWIMLRRESSTMGRPSKYPVLVRERAVRLARERQAEVDDGSRQDLLSTRKREELA